MSRHTGFPYARRIDLIYELVGHHHALIRYNNSQRSTDTQFSAFRCLRPPPHVPAPFHYLHCALPPPAPESSLPGHSWFIWSRLFLSAFMLASKVICDDTYSNKPWAIVGQGLFALREINQMEREMCGYLEWRLNVAPEELKTFEKEVRKVFSRERRGYQWEIPTTTSTTPAPAAVPAVPEKEAMPAKQHLTVKISDQAPVVIPNKPQLPTPTDQPNGVAWPRHPSHASAAPAMQQLNLLSSTVSKKSGPSAIYPLPPSTLPSPSAVMSPVEDAPQYSTAAPAARRHGSQLTNFYGSAAVPYNALSSRGTAVRGVPSRRISYQPYNYGPLHVSHTQPHAQNISPAFSTASSVMSSTSTESSMLPTPPSTCGDSAANIASHTHAYNTPANAMAMYPPVDYEKVYLPTHAYSQVQPQTVNITVMSMQTSPIAVQNERRKASINMGISVSVERMSRKCPSFARELEHGGAREHMEREHEVHERELREREAS